MPQESLETYFNAEELDAARKFVEIFQGKMLVSDKLSRAERVLMGIYMLCNSLKTNDIPKEDAAKFAVRLGSSTVDVSKGLNDLKNEKLVSQTNGNLALTFAGLRHIREMLAPTLPKDEPQQLPASEAKDVPSIGTPSTAKEAIASLLKSDWGKKPRTSRDIADALEINALYYPQGTLAGVLNYMTRLGELRRIKQNGTFSYVLKKR